MRLGNRQRALLRDLRDGKQLRFRPDSFLPARLESWRTARGDAMFITIDKRVPESLYQRGFIRHDGTHWTVTEEAPNE